MLLHVLVLANTQSGFSGSGSGPGCLTNEEPSGLCAVAGRKRSRGTGTEYAGWCACPEGSFCHGSGCDTTTPRQLWNPDEVSVHFTLVIGLVGVLELELALAVEPR